MNTLKPESKSISGLDSMKSSYNIDALQKLRGLTTKGKISYPVYFMSKDDYADNYTIAVVFEDGRYTLMRQIKLIKEYSHQVISAKDKFFADSIINTKGYKRDGIYVDFEELDESLFHSKKNEFAYQLFEKNLRVSD